MEEGTPDHIWLAEDYHYYSSAQYDAASQILEKIHLKGNETILDVGCGEGKITAKIAERLPNGFVTGLDLSIDMVEFAKKKFTKENYPNLKFFCCDAQQLNYYEEIDVIFSSFALQWMPNPIAFFKNAYKSLKFGGCFAATIPLCISSILEEAIRTITACPRWKSYFHNFSPGWHFLSESGYIGLLSDHQFVVNRIDVVTQVEVFSSRANFEKYVIQWFSYLGALPQHLQHVFFKQVMDTYLEMGFFNPNSEIDFKFLRLDVEARKDAL